MSAVLDNVYYSLLDNQVPTLWASNAYPSLKSLFSWVKDLNARVQFFQKWIITGNPTNKFSLPYFFFPQGFLTAVLQTYSRKEKQAIDTLKYEFRVIDPEKDSTDLAPEAGGVYIEGLFLEGARWDKKRRTLADQFENVMYDEMLPIIFTPVVIREPTGRESKKLQRQQQVYRCPLYKTTVRAGELSTTGQSTNFIQTVLLPTLDKEGSFWSLRGAALICQLND
jgi:dynein heavy chain